MAETYKFEPHNRTGAIVGKRYCTKCGLLFLSNDFTRWADRMGCNNSEHPQYKAVRKQLTGDRQ